MGNLEIPDSWVDAALAAGTARFRMDGVWFHYEAAEAIARRVLVVELRRLADTVRCADPANGYILGDAADMICERADELDRSGERSVREFVAT